MTARHASPVVSIEIEAAGGARSLTLRDRTGFGTDELILDVRPSALDSPLTELAVEIWRGDRVATGAIHLTTVQLDATIAVLTAARQEAEGRR